MTRQSKQEQRRNMSPRKPKLPGIKTGPKKDNLPVGHRVHENALTGDVAATAFIGKVKSQ